MTCGTPELRVIALDDDTVRGWCCIEHAQRAGWPWLEAVPPHQRRAVAP